MTQKIKRGDLGKLGNQFVIAFQAEPLIIMPIVLTNPNMHRTDVPINDKELFCLKKPAQEVMTIKLIEAKTIDSKNFTKIGKVSKASMNRIDLAIKREKENLAREADRSKYSLSKAYAL